MAVESWTQDALASGDNLDAGAVQAVRHVPAPA